MPWINTHTHTHYKNKYKDLPVEQREQNNIRSRALNTQIWSEKDKAACVMLYVNVRITLLQQVSDSKVKPVAQVQVFFFRFKYKTIQLIA